MLVVDADVEAEADATDIGEDRSAARLLYIPYQR